MHSDAAALPAEEQAALVRSDGRRHHLALDSLRGICACSVAIQHFASDAYLNQNLLVKNAFLFVDFFFVLSGFVIAESYRSRLERGYPLSRFMGLRLGRLVPLHAAVLLALLALQVLGGLLGLHFASESQHSAKGFLVSFFLLQFLSDYDTVSGWNRPSWSISAELWTYLIFALVAKFCGKHLNLALVIGVIVAPFFIEMQGDTHINVWYHGALARCIFGFFIGVLCNDIWHGWAKRIELGFVTLTALELVCIAACAAAVCILGSGPFSYLAPPLFAIAILLFAKEGGAVSRLMLTWPFLKLGTLSYSLYLIHEFVQARVMNVLALCGWQFDLPHGVESHGFITRTQPFAFASDILTITLLALTIALATLTYRFVEMPGRLLSRRWFAGRRPA